MKQNGRGGHNRKDYALTIDTAKKVAMALLEISLPLIIR